MIIASNIANHIAIALSLTQFCLLLFFFPTVVQPYHLLLSHCSVQCVKQMQAECYRHHEFKFKVNVKHLKNRGNEMTFFWRLPPSRLEQSDSDSSGTGHRCHQQARLPGPRPPQSRTLRQRDLPGYPRWSSSSQVGCTHHSITLMINIVVFDNRLFMYFCPTGFGQISLYHPYIFFFPPRCWCVWKATLFTATNLIYSSSNSNNNTIRFI